MTFIQLTLPSGAVLQPPAIPRTWTDKALPVYGDAMTAPLMEADVSAAIQFHRARPLFQGVQTVATSLTTGVWTPLALAELVDNIAAHSDTVNTSRWYWPSLASGGGLGWFLVTGYVPFNSTNVANSHIAGVRVTGGTPIEGGKTTAGPHGVTVMVTDLIQIDSASGYLELMAWQGTGSTITTLVNSVKAATLTARWVACGTGTTAALPSTPRTWLAADQVTGTLSGAGQVPFNTHIRDVIRWLNYPAIARITAQTSSQTIASGGSFVSVAMPTATVDPYGMWSSGSNTKLTCQRAGMYQVGWLGAVAESGTNSGYRACRVLHTIAAGGSATYGGNSCIPATTSAAGTALSGAAMIRLAVNDTIELQIAQTQGSALAVKNAAGDCARMYAVWRSL